MTRLLSMGLLRAGWDAILTGLALLYVAYLLCSVPWDVDRAAPVVGVALALVGAWQLERGVRATFQRTAPPPDRRVS